MVEEILPWVILAVGSGLLAHALLGRLGGFHRPLQWQGGGQFTLTAELACAIFVLSIGLAALQRTAVWIVPALLAWIVGYVSQHRAQRRHAAQEQQLRTKNAAAWPDVFDNPPPTDMDAMQEDEFDVFDNGACTYLGRATRQDLQALIDRFANIPEQGANDLFIIPESIVMLPEDSLTPQFAALLQQAFEKRDFLVLRWMPPSQLPQQKSQQTSDRSRM